jgi:hypothetical protein
MNALSRTGLILTVLACSVAVSCGKSQTAPSLATVDPATVLFADDFDTENNRQGVFDWTSFVNWNVLEGCVDLHGNGFVDVQPGKGLYVDLDGSCDDAGTIETRSAFTLAPGNYIFEFFLAGNQRINSADTVNVSLGSLLQETFVLQQRDRFELRTRNISVASQTSVRIRFENLGGDGRGGLVDLVRLRRAQ